MVAQVQQVQLMLLQQQDLVEVAVDLLLEDLLLFKEVELVELAEVEPVQVELEQ